MLEKLLQGATTEELEQIMKKDHDVLGKIELAERDLELRVPE